MKNVEIKVLEESRSVLFSLLFSGNEKNISKKIKSYAEHCKTLTLAKNLISNAFIPEYSKIKITEKKNGILAQFKISFN